jgi:hypothetical protein
MLAAYPPLWGKPLELCVRRRVWQERYSTWDQAIEALLRPGTDKPTG